MCCFCLLFSCYPIYSTHIRTVACLFPSTIHNDFLVSVPACLAHGVWTAWRMQNFTCLRSIRQRRHGLHTQKSSGSIATTKAHHICCKTTKLENTILQRRQPVLLCFSHPAQSPDVRNLSGRVVRGGRVINFRVCFRLPGDAKIQHTGRGSCMDSVYI